MTTQELRLGNWILPDKTKIPMRVVNLGTDYLYLDFEGNEGDVWEPDMKKICGIPLTEELLLKCGFDIRENIKGVYGKTYGVHYNIDYVYCIQRDWRGCPSYFFGIECTDSPFPEDENRFRSVSYEVKYVHQLQNIIHALNGEELEINL